MARTEEQKSTVIGLNRFGLGARPGDLSTIGNNIREAFLQEIAAKTAIVPAKENLMPAAEAFRRLKAEREEIKAQQERVARAQAKPISGSPAASHPALVPDAMPKEEAKNPLRRVVREIFQAETAARLEAAKQALTGFAERLVLFWSNHFCVSARKAGVVRVMAGAYEREVIRPHVFGRFEDMLLAAGKHPAMLVYLDNVQSIGPRSRGGQRQQKGLNENLAREIMELHTLGVDGGYTQEDVTSFARVLTGWRFAQQASPFGEEGHFVFNPNLHEPGNHTVMGAVYREDGARQIGTYRAGKTPIHGQAHCTKARNAFCVRYAR